MFNNRISIVGKEVFEATKLLGEKNISFCILEQKNKRSSYPPSSKSKSYNKDLYMLYVDEKYIVYKVEIGGFDETR